LRRKGKYKVFYNHLKIKYIFFIVHILLYGEINVQGQTNTKASPNAYLRSVELDAVHWTEGFMYDQWLQCRDVMIQGQWSRWESDQISHAWSNFLIAAGLKSGDYVGVSWLDGDVYKWMESAIFMLAQTNDPTLEAQLDSIINIISQVQQSDGFVYTKNIIAGNPVHTSETVGPEMYSNGHLFSAAAVHHRATGKSNFLDIAIKLADHILDIYPDHPGWYWDHTLIMGLVELYRQTGATNYLNLAWSIIDAKGNPAYTWLTDNTQDRVPFAYEIYAVGHAQRANYLYAGAADVIAEMDDENFYNTLMTIWQDVVYKKMYSTGGCGSIHQGESPYSPGVAVSEAYGAEYYLPNTSAYNETCAQVGNALWNWRMLTLTGDAKFADIIELELFNGALSGISRDGLHFFYTNVLRRVQGEPLLWMDTATRTTTSGSTESFRDAQCCPPNIIRLISMAQNMAYSISDDKKVWVNLYGSNQLNTAFNDASVLDLTQEAVNYPWDGNIKIIVNATNVFGIMLRIPEWATDVTIKINGDTAQVSATPGMYTELNSRNWSSGDVVELILDMPTRIIDGNPLVSDINNKISVKRGPVIYCVESVDLPAGIGVDDVLLPKSIDLQPHYESEILGGVTVLDGQAFTSTNSFDIRMIPYYAWSNRGISSMRVWLKTYQASNKPPIAVIEAFPTNGEAPLTVQFDGSGSSDLDGDSLHYLWDFGDGVHSFEINPSYTYNWEGVFKVALVVDDDHGGIDTTTKVVEVNLGSDGRAVLADFEYTDNGMQGFEDANWYPGCLIELSRIDDPTNRSQGVLSIKCDASKSDRVVTRRRSVDPHNAPIIEYYLYLPSDFPDYALISVWGDDNVNGWMWNSTDYRGEDLSKETWVPIFFYMEQIHLQNPYAFNPYGDNYLDQTGVQFYFGSNNTWKGTIYLDEFALTITDTISYVNKNEVASIPETTRLLDNYPNPFNLTTNIPFDIHKKSLGSLVVYNLLGHRIKTLWKGTKPAGRYTVVWDGTNESGSKVASGIYLYVLNVDNVFQPKKMILLK
jgi:DUF1680 family protein